MNRKILNASEGMIFTNGEIYGAQIYLAEGVDETTFYEITRDEYDRIMSEREHIGIDGGW